MIAGRKSSAGVTKKTGAGARMSSAGVMRNSVGARMNGGWKSSAGETRNSAGAGKGYPALQIIERVSGLPAPR